jgi:DNA polymerase-3 subunit delta
VTTTLTGENDFARSQALKRRVAEFVAEHGDLALERLDGEETDFVRMGEALTSLPFLASKKMVIIQRPSANKEFAEAAEKLLADLPETTDLILVEPKFDKRSSLYKFLKKQTDFREFTEMDGPALAKWLSAEAGKRGATLSLSDARYLVERVGQSQQLLANELEKLCLRAATITRPIIDELTEATPQSTIFNLIDAAMSGDTKRAMQLYGEQRQLKVEPQQILALFAWQLHVLALVRAAGARSADDIAHDAKLSPFVVRKSQGIARRMELSRLKLLIAELLTIDRRSKREPIDLDDALQYFVLQLAY